ncbi:hypothetical protein HWV62_7864 [Athelia sp. TMB]|nr:hypothetical protein HWV62_7864 [Athelia sp. TMB]
MSCDDDWSAVLSDHPIFSLPKAISNLTHAESSLELSTNTLPSFTRTDQSENGPTPSGRRQVMLLKNEDLIVAAGKELRMSCLGDSRLGNNAKKTFKVLHTPNVQFEISQLVLNPNGKLLAVVGAYQVAVVVLPRSGYSRLVPTAIDCKSIQVGQFYHASDASAAIAKVEWHPWGEAGSTLMVMTVDGKLREYDISVDTEEPQQVLSFVPEKKSSSYVAEDPSEREVASFTLGRGKADWGPLTVYTVMKSGDIYSMCPYMPRNASVPSSYVHALDTFTTAKKDFLSRDKVLAPKAQSTLYNNQSLYIKSLTNQLPRDLVLGTTSRSVLMHPPTTVSHRISRQGPFLLQPSPRILEGGEGGDATDIVYLAFGTDEDDEGEGETERLGVVLVAYQDGRVDVCLDVEKVEARWDSKTEYSRDLPMLAVYETIDLGLVSSLSLMSNSMSGSSAVDLLAGNHPVFLMDPIHDDTVYVYHAFGVHALYLGPVLQSLAAALRIEDSQDGAELSNALEKCGGTNVQPILSTFSVERSIFILTSAWRICTFPLNLRSDPPRPSPEDSASLESTNDQFLKLLPGPPTHISLLSIEPFHPSSVLSRSSGLPSNPRLAIGSPSAKQEFMLTPDSLRYFATTVQELSNQIHDVILAHRAAEARAVLQKEEFVQMQKKSHEMVTLMADIKGRRYTQVLARVERVKEAQKTLMARSDRVLQALVNKASPELSEHETRWFEELRRMKDEVVGAGRYDEGSLAARSKLVHREYDRLLPSLKDLYKQETERRERQTDNNEGLGFTQAFELGQRSNNERERIAALERDVLKLAAKLEISVGRPPSRAGSPASED